MKKKIFSSLLMAAFVFGTVGTFVSCKDYDDEVNDLQSQIDALSKRIDQIESQITGGSVITSVTSITNGIRITLSNNTSYDITNGTNGTNGIAYTIDETTGHWLKDGVDTGLNAIGQKGDDGDKGNDGADGKTIYYVPNATTGYFDKVTATADGTVVSTEATSIAWKSNSTDEGGQITAVMDADNLTLYGVPDENGTIAKEGIKIALSNNLRAIVFEKDNLGRVYVDGVPGIRVASFSYNAKTLADKDSKSEKATGAEKATVVNPTTYAYYHANPANARVEDLKNLSFVVKANADYINTRANASADFDATATFDEEYGLKDGVFRVKVDVTGTPATEEKISVVALQTVKENGENITSDYATIYKNDMKELRLANKKWFAETPALDSHFRRATAGIDGKDNEAGVAYDKATSLKTLPVWSTTNGEDADLYLEYNGSLNLNDYVEAHELLETHTVADLASLGFGIKYEVVQKYEIGTNKTDQADFVTLNEEDGTVSARVFDDANKYAAVGRTPVIRVTLYDKNNGNQAVEIAYIKIKIVKPDEIVENKSVEMTLDNFTFVCEKEGVVTSTVKQINVQLYNFMEMDRDLFHNSYEYFVGGKATGDDNADATDADFKDNVGTVKEKIETIDGETTHLLQWTLTNDEMWKYAGEEVKHVCKYYVKQGSKLYVKITLKAKVDGIQKTYDIAKADFISEYWNADKTQAKFNVAVPDPVGTEDNNKCVMVNDLNSPFTTDGGKLKLDKAITNFSYYFCKDIEEVTKVGDIDVKFAVADVNGVPTLNATVDGVTEAVATIDNTGSAVPYNTVTLSKTSDIAKQLLNTNEFEVYYGVNAYVCEDATKQVTVTFNGEDHFAALFVRPVNIAEEAADNFVDAVDFGEKGSYIDLKDLISPSDWRGRSFSSYTNYWKYYGPFSISVDETSMKCNLTNSENPDGTKMIDVPATMEVKQTAAGDLTIGTTTVKSEYGFLTYKNNGTHVKDFNLYIKVKVDYGWGTILTDYITVPVKETIAK